MTKRELLKELHSFGDDGEVFIAIGGALRRIGDVHPASDYIGAGPTNENLDDAVLVVDPEL